MKRFERRTENRRERCVRCLTPFVRTTGDADMKYHEMDGNTHIYTRYWLCPDCAREILDSLIRAGEERKEAISKVLPSIQTIDPKIAKMLKDTVGLE